MKNIHLSDKHKAQIKVCIEQNHPLLLVGETGTGKTTIIREFAKKYKNTLHRVSLNGGTSTDEIIGKFVAKQGETVWIDGLLLTAMKKGEWIVFDEINSANSDVLFSLHALLDDERKITVTENENEVVVPHKNFRFFATMNPSHDYAGTKEMNQALLSRFMKLEIPTIPEDKELELLISKGIKKETATKLVSLASNLRREKRQENIYYHCSTRDIIQAGLLEKNGLDFDYAVEVAISNKMDKDDLSYCVDHNYLSKSHMEDTAKTLFKDIKRLEQKIKKLQQDKLKIEEVKQKEIDEKNKKLKEQEEKILKLENDLIIERNNQMKALQTNTRESEKIENLEKVIQQLVDEKDKILEELNESRKNNEG